MCEARALLSWLMMVLGIEPEPLDTTWCCRPSPSVFLSEVLGMAAQAGCLGLNTSLIGLLPWPSLQMLMPKKNRIAIYELLFKEGVMVAKKDVHMPKHPELADKNVPNLHVMKAMQVTREYCE